MKEVVSFPIIVLAVLLLVFCLYFGLWEFTIGLVSGFGGGFFNAWLRDKRVN